ncbi:hypothetical protein ACLOJK_025341 [Asimina triloba]
MFLRKGSICLQVSKKEWVVAYQAKVRAKSLRIMATTTIYEAEEEVLAFTGDTVSTGCVGNCDMHLFSSVKAYFGESNSALFVQTLRKFPLEGLSGKVVLVRFDANLLLKEALDFEVQSVRMALCTIKYLYNAGAKLLLASDWSQSRKSTLLSAHAVAVIQLKVVPANQLSGDGQPKLEKHDAADILLVENLSKYKEEFANCAVFAERLSSGVDIFVNDAFALSHKILASTVGIAQFCHSSVAGFCFEEELSKLIDITETKKRPYISIVRPLHNKSKMTWSKRRGFGQVAEPVESKDEETSRFYVKKDAR